jgi:hypothetical protein
MSNDYSAPWRLIRASQLAGPTEPALSIIAPISAVNSTSSSSLSSSPAQRQTARQRIVRIVQGDGPATDKRAYVVTKRLPGQTRYFAQSIWTHQRHHHRLSMPMRLRIQHGAALVLQEVQHRIRQPAPTGEAVGLIEHRGRFGAADTIVGFAEQACRENVRIKLAAAMGYEIIPFGEKGKRVVKT